MTRNLRTLVALALFSTTVLACSIEGASGPGPAPAGAVRGELDVYSASFPDGTSEQQYFLRVMGDSRDQRRLRFSSNPDLVTGLWLDVWGQNDGQEILVEQFAALADSSPSESSAQALITGTPFKPRNIVFVLVDLGSGVNLTKEAAMTRLMGTEAGNDSVRQFFIENSFGLQDVTAQVAGPLTYTMSDCATSSTTAMATALRPQITGTFDQYFWYMGSKVSACSWSGLAMVGSPDRPAKDTWFNASSGCVVLVHEPGHNLGLKHASSMKCGTDVFVDAPDGVCTHSEYGDTLDAMGSSCRHMSSVTKGYEKWFGGCNQVDVTATGTFTLLPIEVPCDGIQGLQIAMPKTRPFYRSGGGGSAGTTNLTHYYIEFRSAYGFDGKHGTMAALKPQVQIRVSGDLRKSSQSGLNTWYLDMDPATTALDGLLVGGTFKDPAGGITIKVDAIETTKATVSVEIENGTGAPTCMDGTSTVTAPGPGPESCAAAPAVPSATPVVGDGGLIPVQIPDAGPSRDANVRRDVAADAVRTDAGAAGGSSGTGSGGASASSSRTAGSSGTASGGNASASSSSSRGGSGGSGSSAVAGSSGSGGSASKGGSQGASSSASQGGSQAAYTGSSGSGGSSGSSDSTTTSAGASSGGCSCALAGTDSHASGGLAGLLFLALALTRARRRNS
jgi:MYXO-CTERM domain-containing protein